MPAMTYNEVVAWIKKNEDRRDSPQPTFCHQSDPACAETCAAWHALQLGKSLDEAL